MIQTDLSQASGRLTEGQAASTPRLLPGLVFGFFLSYLEQQLDSGLKVTAHESADRMVYIIYKRKYCIIKHTLFKLFVFKVCSRHHAWHLGGKKAIFFTVEIIRKTLFYN